MKKQDDIYVLMSLRKEYFDEMLVGLKKYEYRTRYQKVPTKAFIYISKTEKKIKAIINFGTPIISNREAISEIVEKEKAGSYKAMMEYLINGIGYALPIKSITEIEEISLEELKIKFTDFVVPQSCCLQWRNLRMLLRIQNIRKSFYVFKERSYFEVDNKNIRKLSI